MSKVRTDNGSDVAADVAEGRVSSALCGVERLSRFHQTGKPSRNLASRRMDLQSLKHCLASPNVALSPG